MPSELNPVEAPEADRHDRLELARSLVRSLEAGDESEADRLCDLLIVQNEETLYREVGKLTRQLHDSMVGFALDSRLSDLTAKDIPDAKERLNYVIAMTEQAANATLGVVEELLPVSESLCERSQVLNGQWSRFLQREMPYTEFKELSHHLTAYLDESGQQLQVIQSKLTEVLMAQGFQDITGQIIRRVIDLVQDLELNLVELIRITGGKGQGGREVAAPEKHEPLGPSVPGLDQGAVHSQDDVDELLSSLGF